MRIDDASASVEEDDSWCWLCPVCCPESQDSKEVFGGAKDREADGEVIELLASPSVPLIDEANDPCADGVDDTLLVCEALELCNARGTPIPLENDDCHRVSGRNVAESEFFAAGGGDGRGIWLWACPAL